MSLPGPDDNKKDYYDYISGIYGIDDLVVYDRRGSITLNSGNILLQGLDYYFSTKILFTDKPLSEKRYWELKSIVRYHEAKASKNKYSKKWKEGDVYHFVLEVGYTHYRFEVERWIEDKKQDNAHVEYRLIDTLNDVQKRYSNVPMCIILCQVKDWRWITDEVRWIEIDNTQMHRVENPILTDTFITKIIPPANIWQALYDYLSSLKDKPFTDTRTDVEKLESAGFDKITSFRNVK